MTTKEIERLRVFIKTYSKCSDFYGFCNYHDGSFFKMENLEMPPTPKQIKNINLWVLPKLGDKTIYF